MPVKQASAVVAVVVVQSIVELLSLSVVVVHLGDSATHPVRAVTIVDLEWADSNLDAIGLYPADLSIVVGSQNLRKLIWKSMLANSSLVHHDLA